MNRLNILTTIFAGCTLLSCSSAVTVEVPLKSVKVETIAYQKIDIIKLYPTQLQAKQRITIKTEVGGTIEKIYFKEGSFVKAGEKLYSIDQTRYQGQYQESSAQLQAAKARYEQAQKDAQRYKNLWENNAVEAIELDRILLQEQTAFSEWNVAKAQNNRINANLRYATLVAPFSGYIGVSYVKVGDLVIPNQSTLAILVEKDNMTAEFFISEKDYFDWIGIAQKNPQMIDLSFEEGVFEFELILGNGQKYSQIGKLEFIDNIIDPSTGTLRIHVLFDNKDNLLKSGMNAVVEMNLKQQSQKPVVVIAQKTIRKVLNQNFVYIVDSNDQIQERKIELGPGIKDQQVVQSGLNIGDRLVIEDIQKLSIGQKVQVVF